MGHTNNVLSNTSVIFLNEHKSNREVQQVINSKNPESSTIFLQNGKL